MQLPAHTAAQRLSADVSVAHNDKERSTHRRHSGKQARGELVWAKAGDEIHEYHIHGGGKYRGEEERQPVGEDIGDDILSHVSLGDEEQENAHVEMVLK